MRFPLAVILLAACGGSSKPVEPAKPVQPTPAPAPVATPAPDGKVNVLWDEAKLGPAPKPIAERPAPPPKPPTPPIHDRLHDEDGPVAGLTGFSTKRIGAPNRCGGFVVIARRPKKIDPTDANIAALFAMQMPVGLDFSEPKKAGSMLKFKRFVDTLTKTLEAAKKQYEAEFASTDPAIKAASSGRLAQSYFRAASLLARSEVPVDIRAHELAADATEIYCEAMNEQAERFLGLASDALTACRKFTLVAPAGWWAELCKAP